MRDGLLPVAANIAAEAVPSAESPSIEPPTAEHPTAEQRLTEKDIVGLKYFAAWPSLLLYRLGTWVTGVRGHG